MRISDWSSDVCSSDLRVLAVDEGAVDVEDDEAVAEGECRHGRCLYHVGAACLSRFLPPESPGNLTDRHAPPPAPRAPRPPRPGRLRPRSEERRLGKACVRPCRYRWSPSD